MRTMRLLGVLLVCAAAAGGCPRKSDARKPDKPAAPGAGSEAARKPAGDPALGEKARDAQRDEAAPPAAQAPRPAPRPTDDDNPEAPTLTTMEKNFLGVREGMASSDVAAAMDAKPSQTGQAVPDQAAWAAWQEGDRRFVVLTAAGRCALKGSYDPHAPDGAYDQFQQIAPGMTAADVGRLLGSGGRPAPAGPKAIARVYDCGENSYLVVFLDDKVAAVLK